jgi:hypothetical protein
MNWDRNNGCPPCCGREPMLRIRKKRIGILEFESLQFECAVCGKEGGIGFYLAEAVHKWTRKFYAETR